MNTARPNVQTLSPKTMALSLTVLAAFGMLLSGCGGKASPNTNLSSVSNQNIYRIGSASIEAWGVAVTESCSYYTSTTADVDVTVRDGSIVWGSKVYLISGLTSAKPLNPSFSPIWDARAETEMKSVSDFSWKARRSATLVERGHSLSYDSISFVMKVVSPMGEVRYIKPSSGDSYLNATFDLGAAECRRDNHEPVMKAMKLTAVIN
jgi:hypothetical protein